MVRARSLQRKPEAQRWSADVLAHVNQRPQEIFYRATALPTGHREPQSGLEERVAEGDEPPKTRASTHRDLRVTLEDLGGLVTLQ